MNDSLASHADWWPAMANLRAAVIDMAAELNRLETLLADDRSASCPLATEARAILADQPQLPVDGEVAEVLRGLLNAIEGWEVEPHPDDPLAIAMNQARAILPQPADVSYEFIVSGPDYCTVAGGLTPSLQQAIDEGRHYLAQYLQDGPHTLEVRRVETILISAGEDQ